MGLRRLFDFDNSRRSVDLALSKRYRRENMSPRLNPVDAKKLVFKIAHELFPGTGCHDASCVFGHPGGMATNGGCACIKGEKVELRRNLQKLSQVARELASRMLQDRDS
jgi:hypothetical protein